MMATTKYSQLPTGADSPEGSQELSPPNAAFDAPVPGEGSQPIPPAAAYPAVHPVAPMMPPVHSFQQSSHTAVVMQQPAPLAVVAPQPPPRPKPTLLILSIVFALVTTFLGGWPAWFCLYPSVIFAIVGYSLFDSHREDQRKTALVFNNLSMGFTIAGITTFGVCVVLSIIMFII